MPKYIGLFKATLIVLLFFIPVVYAEDYSNTINSVSVKQSGNDGVVVDVYVNSKDKNVKPEISTRKHGDKQFVIDLMKVTKSGSVNKNASESSGMVENKGVHVGNTSGGSARVVLDLNNPNVKLKDVRYHFVDEKNTVMSNSFDQNKSVSVIQNKQQIKPIQNPVKKTPKPSVLNPKATKPVVINTTRKSNTKPTLVNGINHKTNDKNQVLYSKQSTNQKKIITPTKKSMELDEKTISSAPISTNVEHKGTSSQVKHLFHKEQPAVTPVVHNKEQLVNNKQPVPVKSEYTVSLKPKQKHTLETAKPEPPKTIVHSKEQIKSVSAASTANQKQMLAQAKEDTIKPVSNVEKKIQNTKPEPKKQVTNIEHTPVNFENEVIEGGNIRTVNTENSGVDPMGMLFTLIGALVVIIPLIFFVAWLINIFYKGGNAISIGGFGSLDGNKFKILASTSLGQGRSIHLVEIRGRQLVIGCTNSSINVLSEFTEFDEFVENEEVEGIKEIPANQKTKFKKSRPPIGSFTELYKNYQGKVDQQDLEDEY